jgi:hypothetical protein
MRHDATGQLRGNVHDATGQPRGNVHDATGQLRGKLSMADLRRDEKMSRTRHADMGPEHYAQDMEHHQLNVYLFMRMGPRGHAGWMKSVCQSALVQHAVLVVITREQHDMTMTDHTVLAYLLHQPQHSLAL